MRSSASQDSGLATLSDYGGVLWRRKWLISFFALLGLLIGLGYAMLAPKVYEASTSVLVKPVLVDPLSTQDPSKLVNLDTEAQVAQSTAVGDIAGKSMTPPQSADEVTSSTAVTVPPNSSVLQIAYDADTAVTAQQGANAVAAAYLKYRGDVSQQQITTRTADIGKQIDALNGQLRDVTGQLQTTPANSPNYSYLQSQQRVISSQITNLQDAQTRLAQATVDPGQVIDAATLPSSPSSPKLAVGLLAGLAVGLLLGIGVAFLRDRRNPRMWTRHDAEESSGLPVLIEVPNKKPTSKPRSMELAGTKAYEAYRRLANSLVRLGEAVDGRVIVVASASGDLTAGAVATNLSCVLARAGSRTVLLSADFKLSDELDVLDMANGHGLAEVLLGEVGIGDVARPASTVPGLIVLTAGQDRDRASNLIPSGRTRTLLDTLRRTADYVIIEAPPITVSADAQALASFADAVVVTAVSERTGRGEFVEVRRLLEQVRARVLGMVVLAKGWPRPADELKSSRRKTVKRKELAAVVDA